MAPLVPLASLACGHGTIVLPPSRFNATIANGGSCVSGGSPILPKQPCASPAFQNRKPDPGCQPGGQCLWFSQGCTIGCPKCGGSNGAAGCIGQASQTLPQKYRTFNVDNPACGTNPWCKPGSAPVMDPCGVAGGDINPGQVGNGGVPPDFYKQGHHGSHVKWGAGTSSGLPPVTQWRAGSVQDVAWAITANHGGGYQYRLCKRGGVTPDAEACFQRTPLAFANKDTQWIQYGDDASSRVEIPALTVTGAKTVVPPHSHWRRNPIPACSGPGGGSKRAPCLGFQFTPPGPDLGRPGKKLGGFGSGACDSGVTLGKCTDAEYANHMFTWSIVDKVEVPDGLEGDYVLSFRWDSEQTPQIWAGCSDITIVPDTPIQPTPAPAPAPVPAALYGCFNSVCLADPNGVPQQTCLAVCT